MGLWSVRFVKSVQSVLAVDGWTHLRRRTIRVVDRALRMGSNTRATHSRRRFP